MAHQWALSVSHDNMDKEIWLKRMAESDVRNYEYSCGPVPGSADVRKKYEFLKPWLGQGVQFLSVYLPFWWGAERPAQPEEFERDISMLEHGILSREEFRMKWINEDEQTAKDALADVRKENAVTGEEPPIQAG